jgi:hypothetical protein
MPDPTNAKLAAALGLLRQLLLAFGALLAAHGLIGPNNSVTPENWDFLVGALITAIPVIWSWVEKFNAASAIEEKQRIAVQAGIAFAKSLHAQGSDAPRQISSERALHIIDTHK